MIDDLVSEFHRAMDIPVADKPSIPSDERVRLRARLITEEYLETMEALFKEPGRLFSAKSILSNVADEGEIRVFLPDLADGLCDLDYVVAGTRLEFGIPGGAILEEVHAANRRKTGGPIREDGKRMKPAGWTPPDIEGVLKRNGWEPK